MNHLNICNTSYGKKKGRQSNSQFDSDHKKVKIDPTLVRVGGVQHTVGKFLTRAITLF
jgi:hypothetical protein